eukprot:jgi/Ulvmu1/7190/UM034_0099.1
MVDENRQPDANGTVDAASELPDFSVKHPLERQWTLWFDSQKKGNWSDSVRSVCTVSTIEEFWCLFNNILSPSMLEEKSGLKFFVNGVKPDWDDKETASGGIWSVPIKRGADCKERLEQYWVDVVLHILGEQFDEGMDVLGVACNVRKQQDRIEVWTKTASDEAVQYSIGQQLKTLLKLPPSQTIGYTSHEQGKLNSSQNRKGSKMDTYTA